MATNETNGVPADIMADIEVIARCAAAGKPVPADVARRIRERGEQITEEVRRKYGLVDIAVPAIRDLRGELPKP